MATSGSAYDDIMKIPACVAEAKTRVWERCLSFFKGGRPQSGEQEALYLAKRDLIRLDTQIRSSISQLSAAWKSDAEVLKLQKEKVLQKEQFEKEEALQKDQFEKEAATTKKEVEDEAKNVIDIVVASRNKLIQAFYFWGLSREDVNLTLIGKYSEIIFPGDDASPVAEQSPAPPVADDMTKEELFELQCRYGKIKIERDEVLRKESNRFALLQKSLKDKQFIDESDKLEYHRSLLSLTLHFEAEIDSERGLKEAYLELLTEKGIVPDPARVKFLAQEARNRHSIKAQRCSAQAGVSIIWGGVGLFPDESLLNVMTVELSCKDVEILNANNKAELWKESLKKKKLETMAANQQVLDLLSTIKKLKNDLLYHQSVVTNNTDLLKKQDAEIRHMRERLKKLSWDLREA
ncbi:hypothetical protein GIB67_020136 [Kingdonia uniflora]|uniref:Uncharacterized protein n=1 Tax=Kingdonia uniflora TaxID=39325 RepID=A0A7J7NIA9_9MAGN|nr:hypothetical protein GIB67_020136 [Kingdonia uniflora]